MAGEFTTDMGVLAGIQGLNNRFEWYYGDVEPLEPRPFLNWGHLSADLWKQRNAENTAWIIRGILSQPYFGLALADIVDPLGTVKEHYGPLPPRHLWVNGCTIGDAQSNATGRANADTFDLYAVLWPAVDNIYSQIKIYNSDGVLTEKGSSAAEDFAAHKAISLPNKRGRVAIGLDNMGGINANVVTNPNANILGGADGEEKHALTKDENGPHTHGIQTYFGANGSEHGPYEAAQIWRTTVYQTGSAGLGTPHNNMQPWVACNYIMRY